MATFEDQTVDVRCPGCAHLNVIAVADFEEQAESHVACAGCGAHIRIEAQEFRQRLEEVRRELEEFEQEAARRARPLTRRPRKGDFQI